MNSEIREWFVNGVADGARYMLVVYDRMGGPDDFDIPYYYDSAEEAKEALTGFLSDKLSEVQEVYDLTLNMECQLAERRAWHLPGHKTEAERQADIDFSFAEMMYDGSWPLYNQDEIKPERMKADAAEYYAMAVENGHTMAALKLGMMYLDGNGVEQNLTKSKELLEKAAEGEHCGAYELLSQIYWQGLGVEPDAQMAAMWAQKAKDHPHYASSSCPAK